MILANAAPRICPARSASPSSPARRRKKGVGVVFSFMATLSANLGLVNLFPVPMLDGGHLLYYGVEALQGRPLARRLQEYGFRIGMAMIAMLMAFVILNDIRKLAVLSEALYHSGSMSVFPA